MSSIKPGMTFTHWAFLDPDWKPGPGQKYRDGPKALMVVTRVDRFTVWYGYAPTTKPGPRGPGGGCGAHPSIVAQPGGGWRISRGDLSQHTVHWTGGTDDSA